MKTEQNGKTSYTENINTYTVWMEFTFYVCIWRYSDPLKMYHGKDCVEKFIENTEHEIKWLYARFSKQPMTEFTDVLERA